MNIVKKIATPFIAIWRWIKETAWVQPLLIVGAIFAIIFSIPSITKGIQSLINQQESDIKYFENSWLSLEGSKQNEQNSAANKFFDKFVEAQEKWVNNDKEGARTSLRDYNSEDRFFLYFVQEDCSGCSNLKAGSEYLETNWNTYMDVYGSDFPAFKFQSIIVDQEIDDDYYEEEDRKPIDDLVASNSYLNFYKTAMSMVDTQPYYLNLYSKDKTSAETIVSNTQSLNDASKMQTPTVMLIDLTDTNTTNNIISTIFYSLSGSDKYGYAEFLAQAWAGEEDFKNNITNA